MEDFEKLGVFYLGKEYDINKASLLDDLVLYQSKNLTTHAVIIGMTGSGKTGLGISMMEEAALDNIPVIAIDPKGDLGNLALTFPELRGEDFRPWINLQDAESKGIAPDDYANAQAEQWRKGLADWGQDGKRIENFRNASRVTIYTPGSTTGRAVSLLRTFRAPSRESMNDAEGYRDRISAASQGLLSLIGMQGDTFNSREHILLSNIFEYSWNSGKDLTLADLIGAVQNPPMSKLGVMDIESFFPSKDRFELALKLNNLLASPNFKDWMEGEPLDINNFYYDAAGKPRISIFSIAHLTDSERMFFVTMLLNEILSWVRTQPGTGSLRALLYMDEVYGYLPPVANPPSKTPLLTLLKQARAYGLGLVLSTQNPVDLDYKALSNAGSWFIGRLQTDRDKERVIAGLEGAALGEAFNRQRTEQILAGLGKRIFYLHSVHENEPVVFSTRWALSYLSGPLTREQVAALPGNKSTDAVFTDQPSDIGMSANNMKEDAHASAPVPPIVASSNAAPILGPKIKQVFFPSDSFSAPDFFYRPSVLGVIDVYYSDAQYGVSSSIKYHLLTPVHNGPVALNWEEAINSDINLKDLSSQPVAGAGFSDYPSAAADPKNYDIWQKLLASYIRINRPLKLFYASKLKAVSQAGELERDFAIRIQNIARERRDEEVEKLKAKYDSKLDTLIERQRKAEQALERQNTQSSQRKMEAAVSAGTSILGVLFGKKSMSATSISRLGTAVKSTSRALKSGQGISQAEETVASISLQLEELEREIQEQADQITQNFDLTNETFETIEILPGSRDIVVHFLGLAWVPDTK